MLNDPVNKQHIPSPVFTLSCWSKQSPNFLCIQHLHELRIMSPSTIIIHVKQNKSFFSLCASWKAPTQKMCSAPLCHIQGQKMINYFHDKSKVWKVNCAKKSQLLKNNETHSCNITHLSHTVCTRLINGMFSLHTGGTTGYFRVWCNTVLTTTQPHPTGVQGWVAASYFTMSSSQRLVQEKKG